MPAPYPTSLRPPLRKPKPTFRPSPLQLTTHSLGKRRLHQRSQQTHLSSSTTFVSSPAIQVSSNSSIITASSTAPHLHLQTDILSLLPAHVIPQPYRHPRKPHARCLSCTETVSEIDTTTRELRSLPHDEMAHIRQSSAIALEKTIVDQASIDDFKSTGPASG